MAPASYARATASSQLKTQAPSSPSQATPKGKPSTPKKKLSRPSTLTPRQRHTINYHSDLHHIKPHDANKPCHLAHLPSELRTCIYEHVLADYITVPQPFYIHKAQSRKKCYVWPWILHVSRAIRIEAAYLYYTRTPFTFDIRNMNFTEVQAWLDSLPRRHRELLARNRNLTLDIDTRLRRTYTYQPASWLLDAPMVQHWQSCSPWGNLYDLETGAHRLHFILFCRLMNWWKYSSSRLMRDMRWQYTFYDRLKWGQRARDDDTIKLLQDFLNERVRALEMRWVQNAWTRGRDDVVGQKEALLFLSALDEAFGEVREGIREEVGLWWDTVMRRLEGRVEKW